MMKHALCTGITLLFLSGCQSSESDLAKANAELRAQVDTLKAELAAATNGGPRVDRELQTFEDMYVACQTANPDWQYVEELTQR